MATKLSYYFGICLTVGIVAAIKNPAAGRPWNWESPTPEVRHNSIGEKEVSRIIGGTEALPHSWPHQVAIFINDHLYCSGQLISEEWVMTAAHCVDEDPLLVVVMGAHNLTEDEPSQVTMTSINFFTHEEWDPVSLFNDIALVRLPEPVVFNENISAVKLPSADPPIGTMVTPTGWGWTSDSDMVLSDVLRQVDVPTMDIEECKAVFERATDNHICLDSSGGRGTCNCDSGGPINYDGTTLGIFSFYAYEGCEAGYPDAFTRVSAYLDWLEYHTGITP